MSLPRPLPGQLPAGARNGSFHAAAYRAAIESHLSSGASYDAALVTPRTEMSVMIETNVRFGLR